MDKQQKKNIVCVVLMAVVFVALVAYLKPIATGKSNGGELLGMLKYLISGAAVAAGFIIGISLNRAADRFEKSHTVSVIGTVYDNKSEWGEPTVLHGEYNNEDYQPSSGFTKYTPLYQYTAPDGLVHRCAGKSSNQRTPEGTTKVILLAPNNYDDICFPDDLHRTKRLRTLVAAGCFVFAVVTFLQFSLVK